MRKSIMYIGMDVHKESIEIAIAEEGEQQEVRPLRADRWESRIVSGERCESW